MSKNVITLLVAVVMLATTFGSFVVAPKAQAATNLENLVKKLQEAVDSAPETTQQVLLKLLDGIEIFLNTSKTGVAAKFIWTRDQKDRANAKLDEGLAKVQELRSSVESIDLESSAALTDLKALYDEGKNWWAQYRVELKVEWAEILIENGNRAISAAEKIQEEINDAVALINDDKVDTTNLKSLLSQLDAEIEESKNYMTEAVASLEKMRDATKAKDVIAFYIDARLKVQKATANLLEDGATVINEILKEIARLVQEARNNKS